METTLIFNESDKSITIDGIASKLTDKGIAIFKILLSNKNTLVNKNDILLAIWGKTDFFTGRSMDVYMCKLRKVLSTAKGISIENKHGHGFTLLVDNSLEIEIINTNN